MRTKPANSKAIKMIKDIHRTNRKLYSAEEKIRIIVLEGLRGEATIAELCREARDFKEVAAEQTLELRLLIKCSNIFSNHSTTYKLRLLYILCIRPNSKTNYCISRKYEYGKYDKVATFYYRLV